MAKEKKPTIEVNGITYLRIPVKTDVVRPEDKPEELIPRYAAKTYQPGDIIFISEKVVSVTQGRSIPTSEIKVGWLAKILWKRVTKSPYGVGLRNPYSMQCAINECGSLRIILATIVAICGKLLGRKGDFYRVAGPQASGIDAPNTSPVKGFESNVSLGPKDPDQVAEKIKKATGLETAIVDINDLGGVVLGATTGIDRDLIPKILKDNPLGQGNELTPFGIIRKVS
jgi:F420-0:gamma-glutamyl ligase